MMNAKLHTETTAFTDGEDEDQSLQTLSNLKSAESMPDPLQMGRNALHEALRSMTNASKKSNHLQQSLDDMTKAHLQLSDEVKSLKVALQKEKEAANDYLQASVEEAEREREFTKGKIDEFKNLIDLLESKNTEVSVELKSTSAAYKTMAEKNLALHGRVDQRKQENELLKEALKSMNDLSQTATNKFENSQTMIDKLDEELNYIKSKLSTAEHLSKARAKKCDGLKETIDVLELKNDELQTRITLEENTIAELTVEVEQLTQDGVALKQTSTTLMETETALQASVEELGQVRETMKLNEEESQGKIVELRNMSAELLGNKTALKGVLELNYQADSEHKRVFNALKDDRDQLKNALEALENSISSEKTGGLLEEKQEEVEKHGKENILVKLQSLHDTACEKMSPGNWCVPFPWEKPENNDQNDA